MVLSATTLIKLAAMTLTSSSVLTIFAPYLRTVVTTYGGVVPLMLLILYDFYFISNDKAIYMNLHIFLLCTLMILLLLIVLFAMRIALSLILTYYFWFPREIMFT